AQFVRDASSHLTDRGQTFAALLPGQVLGLIGILDDCQVEVEERVQRPPNGQPLGSGIEGIEFQRQEQSAPQTGQRDVGVYLVKADLNVAPADPPATREVILVVLAGKQFVKPGQ